MPVVQIPPLVVLLPIFVLGALSGFKRGWRDEAWTLGALVLTVFVVARPETVLLPMLERVIGAFQRAGQALLGRDTTGPAFRFDPAVRPWAALLAFFVFVALSYAFGHLMGKGEPAVGIAKVLAGLLGAANLLVVALWLVSRFTAVRGDDGALRLIVPPFRGATLVVGAPTTNSVLASWPGLFGLLLVVILFVFLLTRAGRVWR